MKFKFFTLAAAAVLVITACSKKPEDVVKETYNAANEGKWEVIADYLLLDSVAPLNEQEKAQFKESFYHLPAAPMYNALEFQPIEVNTTGDEAHFTVNTTCNDGRSFTEKGTLRKDANGKWKIAIYKNPTDTAALYSVSKPEEFTAELMRNLEYVLDNILASRGLPEYQVKAAQYYYDGVMTKKNYKDYYALIRNAAEKGNQDALLKQAHALSTGNGVEKDLTKAFEIYKQLAEMGNPDGMYFLSVAYREGEGTPKDYKEALKWAEKALEAGNNDANLALGYTYDEGLGVTKNLQKAYEYYVKGAEGGNSTCMFNLGVDYQYGYYVQKDLNKAEEWFKKAYEAGNRYAPSGLGNLYYRDLKDYDKAFYYYKQLADKGDNYGELMVGECYEYGRGVERDLHEAKNWYHKGWSKNYPNAVRAYTRLLYLD